MFQGGFAFAQSGPMVSNSTALVMGGGGGVNNGGYSTAGYNTGEGTMVTTSGFEVGGYDQQQHHHQFSPVQAASMVFNMLNRTEEKADSAVATANNAFFNSQAAIHLGRMNDQEFQKLVVTVHGATDSLEQRLQSFYQEADSSVRALHQAREGDQAVVEQRMNFLREEFAQMRSEIQEERKRSDHATATTTVAVAQRVAVLSQMMEDNKGTVEEGFENVRRSQSQQSDQLSSLQENVGSEMTSFRKSQGDFESRVVELEKLVRVTAQQQQEQQRKLDGLGMKVSEVSLECSRFGQTMREGNEMVLKMLETMQQRQKADFERNDQFRQEMMRQRTTVPPTTVPLVPTGQVYQATLNGSQSPAPLNGSILYGMGNGGSGSDNSGTAPYSRSGTPLDQNGFQQGLGGMGMGGMAGFGGGVHQSSLGRGGQTRDSTSQARRSQVLQTSDPHYAKNFTGLSTDEFIALPDEAHRSTLEAGKIARVKWVFTGDESRFPYFANGPRRMFEITFNYGFPYTEKGTANMVRFWNDIITDLSSVMNNLGQNTRVQIVVLIKDKLNPENKKLQMSSGMMTALNSANIQDLAEILTVLQITTERKGYIEGEKGEKKGGAEGLAYTRARAYAILKRARIEPENHVSFDLFMQQAMGKATIDMRDPSGATVGILNENNIRELNF